MTKHELIADIVVEAVKAQQGRVGVLVRDVPGLDGTTLLRYLAHELEQGFGVRIAYLLADGDEASRATALSGDRLTTRIEQAELWRNDRSNSDLIVVVCAGTESRLSSLLDFATVGPAQLKHRLVERALETLAGVNDVQQRWWRLLRQDTLVSFGQLIDYFSELADLDEEARITQASRALPKLGLLPDPELFNRGSEAQLRTRLKLNRELHNRLQTLTNKDRLTINDNIAREQDPAARSNLQDLLTRLRELRRGSSDRPLTLADAQSLLGLRRPTRRASDDAATGDGRPERRTATEIAAEALIDLDSERPNLDEVVAQLEEEVDKVRDAATLRPERVGIEIGPGTSVQAVARSDLISVMVRVLGDQLMGGWLRVQGESIDEMLRRVQGDEDIIERWQRDDVDRFLTSSDDSDTADVRTAFAAYVDARARILEHAGLLSVAPLAVAAAPTTREHLRAVVDRYSELLNLLHARHRALQEIFTSETEELYARILRLDTIVLESEKQTLALVAPTHPLYLWHFTEYCRIVEEQRDRLSARDRRLVAEAAEDLPIFLDSLCLPPVTSSNYQMLPQIGRVGPIPYYGTLAAATVDGDGRELVQGLIDAYLRAFPPATQGFRLALVDPPDAGAYLVVIDEMADQQRLSGAHVTVLRHPREKVGTELRLDADEEDRVAQRFRANADERRFTFEIRDLDPRLIADPATPAHVLVAFDQTPADSEQLRAVEQPIQPLAIPRRLTYRVVRQTVELEPAPGGLFADYFNVTNLVSAALGPTQHALRQERVLRERLQQASEHAQWFVFCDRHIDRDLSVGTLRIYTGRQGERDVAAFANDLSPFIRALREVATHYNTAITAEQLEHLLDDLSQLLDSGIQWLQPTVDGSVDHNRVKGVLGTLIAARWYLRSTPDGRQRLIVSLDDDAARRWLHLADDPRRADLLGFELSADGLDVEVIEVKAVEQIRPEFEIASGRISGAAIDQLLATHGLLRQVFAADHRGELITTPARRELVRDHAHRELTKKRHTPAARKRWAEALEEALSGRMPVRLRAHLVHVQIGADPATLPPSTHAVADRDGEEITVVVTTLNERDAPELTQPPIPPPPTPGPEGPREPPPTPEPEQPAAPESEVERGREPVDVARDEGRAETSEEAPAGPDAAPRPRAYLGEAAGAYGQAREVFFDPELPPNRLPNAHMLITGESGSGKTQATKAVIRDLVGGYGLPVLILDFKDDYSDPEYTETEWMDVHDAALVGLPFNPLVAPQDPRTGTVNPMTHLYDIVAILKRVYRLGDQQAYHLREAIKTAYEQKGFPTQAFPAREAADWPSFDDVKPILEHADHTALLGRLSTIFDLRLFATRTDEATFERLLDGRTVIRLTQLPGEEVRNALAEIMLLGLHRHLLRGEQPRRLRKLLILDEAWRVKDSPHLEPLMREGRAFGLGVVIASQYPDDLTDAIAGTINTKLYFSQSLPEKIRAIQRALSGRTSGTEADRVAAQVRALRPLQFLLANGQYSNVQVTLKPYFERLETGSS